MPSTSDRGRTLDCITAQDVAKLFSAQSKALHIKVDATRDAYFGYIFPVNRHDLTTVSEILGLPPESARALFAEARKFSTFKPRGRGGEVTNHIYGASILALRGKSLDTGLSTVTDRSLAGMVREYDRTVLEIAEARASWFGRIYFPAQAFSNAIGVFGGKASPESLYDLAQSYSFSAEAGSRRTVRGDFGIAVWLTLLGAAA